MQPTDMSIVLHSFARLRYRDRAMMMRIAEASPPILGQFTAADITHFLAAFARLDVHHRLIFNLFAREIARKLHDFTAAQLGELVYAYARLGMKHDLLLDVLKKRIAEVVKALKPWHLAMIVNGFARLGVSDERFFTVIASEICKNISDFSGRPLALVANAYARLDVKNVFLLEVLGDEVFRRRGDLEPQAVALVLNAHARLQISNPVLFDYFAQDVPRRVKAYTIHSLCLVASAYARTNRKDTLLFQSIGDAVCGKASLLYPRAVAALLYAFSEAEVRHGILFYNAPGHIIPQITAYTTDELAMIAKAYGSFTMVHLPLFDAITMALTERALVQSVGHQHEVGLSEVEDEPPQLEPSSALPRVSSLVWILEAYARLTIAEVQAIQLLCDAITARQSELEPQLVVQAIRAIAGLSCGHDGLLDVGVGCMKAHGEDLSSEDSAQLAEALQTLGAASSANFAGQSMLVKRTERLPEPSELRGSASA